MSSAKTITSANALTHALKTLNGGHPAEAEQICKEVLSVVPNASDAMHILGLALHEQKKFAAAAEWLEKSASVNSNDPQIHLHLGFAREAAGQIDGAESAYRKHCELHPTDSAASQHLARVLQKLARIDDAIAILNQQSAHTPNDKPVWLALGQIYLQAWRIEEGIAHYRRAVAADPAFADAWNNLGNLLRDQGQPEQAEEAYRSAIAIRPDNALALANLGNTWLDRGDFSEAGRWYAKAIAAKPDYAAARLLRCITVLPMIYRDSAEIDAARNTYAAELDALIAHYTRDHTEQLAELGKAIGHIQPFFLPYQQRDDRALQQKYGELACKAAAAAFKHWGVPAYHRPRPEPDGRLRIAFVSAYFRGHSVWKAITRGWLEQLDRSKYVLLGYHTQGKRDNQTDYAERLFDRFVQGPLEVGQWLERIRQDDPHLIIYPEIGMDPMTAKLAAARLAPVQCAAWGHPETTGYPSIDYYLTGELLETQEGRTYYTERLVRLAGSSSHYAPLTLPSATISRAELGLVESDVAYLCCQNLFKYLPEHDEVFPRIARAVPNARFVFFRHKLASHISRIFENRIKAAFEAAGLSFETHCRFHDWMDTARFDAAQRCMDVYLDSIGFSGFNTAIEALDAGLPVVTVESEFMRGRLAAAVLRQIDLTETIATNADQFIDIATQLGNDKKHRQRITLQIKNNLLQAFNQKSAIAALEQFIDQTSANLKEVPANTNIERMQRQAIAHHQAGNLSEAEQLYREVLALRPEHTAALSNLGAVLRAQGKLDEAINNYRQAIKIDPDFADAWYNLGRAQSQKGRIGLAVDAYKRAVDLYGNKNVQALSNLGDALRSANRPAEALPYALKAVEIDPRHAEARLNLANTYRDLGRFDEAMPIYQQALAIKPDFAHARLHACNLMVPQAYPSQADVLPARERYRQSLAALDDYYTREHPEELIELGKAAATSQPFYLPYQGMNDRELLARYGNLICRSVAAAYGKWTLPRGYCPKADPEGKLRIGIVCGLFREHSVWKAIVKGWMEQLDPGRFAFYGYHTQGNTDNETAIARNLCRRFVQGPKDTDVWCQIIRHDDLHLIIYPETGMDPESAKLAALRLAPVQCVTWGHPETSGMPTIDYYLSGKLLEPANAQEHYTEKLVCLPGTSACYAPLPHRGSAKGRTDFGLSKADTVFLSCQMPFKYLPKYDEVFPRIAREVPSARFIFFRHRKSEGLNKVFQARLRAAFDDAGLPFEQHVIISDWLNFDDFQALLDVADLFLDTLGFSGFNTAMEALTAKLPVVTLEGEFMRGRLAAAILRQIDVTEPIAATVDDFTRIAIELGQSHERRKMLRGRIGAALPSAWNDLAPVRALEEFLLKAVRDAATTNPAPPVWKLLTDDPGSDAAAYNHAYVPKGLIELMGRPPRAVLDIGCFVGATGAFIKQRYPQARVIGIEPNPEAAKHAAKRLDHVSNTTLENFDWQAAGLVQGSVDTVILADVLEHLYNPWSALLALKPWLSLDAQVMVSLPNVRNILLLDRTLAKGQWTYERAGLLDVTHIRFFTKSEAIRMFEETGYHVAAISRNTDPRLRQAANTDFQGLPTTTLNTERITLKNVTPQELEELTTLQFFFRCNPGST